MRQVYHVILNQNSGMILHARLTSWEKGGEEVLLVYGGEEREAEERCGSVYRA